MKSRIRNYYLLQAGLIAILTIIVFNIIGSLPYPDTFGIGKYYGWNRFGFTVFAAIPFMFSNLIINGLNFLTIKIMTFRLAYDLTSFLWLVLGLLYTYLIYESGTNSVLEFLPVILCIEPIIYNQRIKRLLI